MSKVMSMRDAVARTSMTATFVAIEGFTHLICFAGVTRSSPAQRDLTLARLTPDLIYDQMVAAGRRASSCSAGSETPASAGCTRSAAGSRTPIVAARAGGYSHFGMVGRYTGRASNLPFFPLRSYFETDLPKANR